MPTGACLVEADSFKCVYGNALFVEFLLGREPQEPFDIAGRPLVELLPEAVRLEVLEGLTGALSRDAAVPLRGLVCQGSPWDLRISPIRESRRVSSVLVAVSRSTVPCSHVAEEPRKAQELQGVLEAMADGVVLFGEDGKVRALNAAASRLIGLDIRGMAPRELLNVLHIRSGDERPVSAEELPEVQALRGHSLTGQRLRVRTFSGPRTVMVSAAPLRADGTTRGAVAIWHDVTERERVDVALRTSQAQLRGLAESGLIGTISFTLSGLITDANDAFLRMTGFTRAELQAGELRWDELTPPEWMPRTLKAIESMRTSGRYTYEKEFLRKDGSRFWGLIGGTLAPGASEGMKFVVDISDRKRAEHALRESEAQLRQLAEAMPQLVWILRADGRHEYMNRQWEELTGMRFESGRVNDWSGLVHPDDRAETVSRWARSFRTGEPFECAFRLRSKSGAYRWLLGRAVPMRDEQGRITRWFGTSTEVHELKEVQGRLREAMARLEEADRRKNEFLALLSHELRNPLAPISNSTFILRRAPAGSAQAARAQQVIERQISHLTRLVDDLLDVTRISRAKIRLQPERVELNTLVRRAVEDLGSLFERAGVTLEAQVPSEPLHAFADRTRVVQVVGNLLNNAAKFTPRGGRTTVTLEQAGAGRSVIRVKDTGAGMDPQTLMRIFEPFTQADQTLDRSRGGLGLGLALVKGLVELHGGSVRAHSDGVGKGAEFVVELPAEEIVPVAAPALVPAPVKRASRRVLLVEDNLDAAESLKEVLSMAGHTVELAGTGPEGVAIARKSRPEVMLCDIGLPEMDGYEVARTLRRDPALRSLRLVAVSGYASPDDVEKSREAGFDGHIAKPPDLELLEEVLATGRDAPEPGAKWTSMDGRTNL